MNRVPSRHSYFVSRKNELLALAVISIGTIGNLYCLFLRQRDRIYVLTIFLGMEKRGDK